MNAGDRNHKRCDKCQDMGHFTAEYPNQRAMTIEEYEGVDLAFADKSDEESEFEAEPEYGSKSLVLSRVLHMEL